MREKSSARPSPDPHPLVPVVPVNGKRMTFEREIVLTDRNRDDRICIAEGFNTGHQTLVLIRDAGLRTRAGIVMPARPVPCRLSKNSVNSLI
jgi:hypothetical protein